MRVLPVLRVLGPVCVICTLLAASLWAQSPGDTVGFTGTRPDIYYYGANLIDVDTSGTCHFVWLNAVPYPLTRQIRYNVRSASCIWGWPQIGESIELRNGCNFPEISSTIDGRAIIVAHYAATNNETVYIARDAFQGIGQFDIISQRLYQNPDAFGWPRLCIDRLGRFHLIVTQFRDGWHSTGIAYTISADEGTTWNEIQTVGQTHTIDAMIVASEVSEKVAIIFEKPFSEYTYSQDISYVQSEDGEIWDFEFGVVNVTNYETNPDSLRPLGQIDAAYDANDNLHIAWNAKQSVNGIFGPTAYLYHFETGSGEISEIAQRTAQSSSCRIESVNAIEQPTIAISQSTNKIVVAYVGYDPADCSADSLPNGDIYLNWSDNYGEDWSNPINVTNSQTPGCYDLECASDVNPSLAPEINDSAHLMYACDNRHHAVYLYYAIPVSNMGTAGNDKLPDSFAISQNYPNPFNAVTTIRINMPVRGHLNLAIYDITGARVTTLVDDIRESGVYNIKWDASEVTSGVYFCRAEAGGMAISKRMVLLK